MGRNFDGTDDRLSNTSATHLDITNISFLVWLQIQTTPAATDMVARSYDNGIGQPVRNLFALLTSGIARFFQNTNNANGIWDGTTNVCDGAVHCLTVTYPRVDLNSNGIWYVDGSEDSTTESSTPTGTLDTGDDELSFGETEAGSLDLTADFLAFTTIWNVILTATETAALATGINPFVLRNDAIIQCNPLFGDESPEGDWAAQAHKMTVTGSAKATSAPPNPPVELLENYI